MAVTCEEKPDSPTYSPDDSAELTYIVKGTADESEAASAVESTAPTTVHTLSRDTVTVEPEFIDTSNPAACIWTGTVRYSKHGFSITVPDTGESTFSFDTGGGSQHITQSLATVASYTASGTAPDFGGAIGVTHDNVEGVDITAPVFNFSETHYIADSNVTSAYKAALFALTGKVNNAAFRGFAAGEVLFLGASGSQRGNGDDWEISFRFAASPNKTGLTVGSMTGIAKKGWEYLWARYADAEDAASKTLVKQPTAAYVEQVYEYGDFSGLGI